MRSFFCIFFLAIAAYCPAQRSHVNFDEDWKFSFGHASDPSKDFHYRLTTIFSKTAAAPKTAIDPRFDDRSWRKLDLPHDWAVELPFVHVKNDDVLLHGYKPVGGMFPETSIGWYRKHFSIARGDSGKRFQIQFDGVFRDAQCWLNGIYLGNNKSGYIGVAYDITDFINYDRENVLVVRVDATQYEGWFYEGAGIYRHVWLNSFDNVHMDAGEHYLYTTTQGSRSAVSVGAVVENRNETRASCTVTSYIMDRTGKLLARTGEKEIRVETNGRLPVKNELSLAHAHLWSPEDPYLYRVVTLVKKNGKTVDSLQHRLGIRTIRLDAGDGFFLNGKHVKIKGVNNHQDGAGVGSAMPDYLQYYRVRLLKDMGCNAIRTAHHAPAPELLDACDSLGILVLDEQRLLNSGAEYMDQFERILKRDRSRTCVFMWSIGNEEGWIHTTTIGKRIAQTLLAKQRELDPTRTSTYAADVANVFKGVNEVIPVRGFNYRDSSVADYHRDHPLQPILGTEMGSTVTTRGIYEVDTLHAYVPDQDITSPWWAARAEEWWPLAAENNYWLGGFVWTGFDYRGEPTPYAWPNINSHFGIMDMCGFPKNIYYYYASWWSNKDVLHISPHWNWKGREGSPIDVWVNSNADDVELFLNGNSLGRKAMPRNGHLQWKVNYAPGTLSATGYAKGRKFTKSVETTTAPAEVVVTPYKTTMLADGKDVTVINISAVDKQGREVPDADNLVRFVVHGDARIIGVGNGDPSSHEKDKYEDTSAERHLFNGKAQVIVQAGKSPGAIQFEAVSEGLWKGSTDIFSIRPAAEKSPTQVRASRKINIGKILGADISFLPELEARGVRFADAGVEGDAIAILKKHGFNYIRLRLFNDPAQDSGYSPHKGFCDLAHTLLMAKRIKAAGMKLLLDFHYSDYWADPGKQYKPAAWKGISFGQLRDSLYSFTKRSITALRAQGTLPDMVQIGNEINHGMVWPDGHVNNLDGLAQLFSAGADAVMSVDPSIAIMLHIALGGQNDESRFFIDQMLRRGVYFDLIGESYYPKWHGTLADLKNNLEDLTTRYDKDVIVVEYSQMKKEVNEIAFSLRREGEGSFIWEPLNTWESVFDKEGKSNAYLLTYDELSQRFIPKNNLK